MNAVKRRSFPITEWPAVDRSAWFAAMVPKLAIFATNSKIAEYGPQTRRSTVLGLGCLMRWLSEQGVDIHATGTASVLTEPLFISFLKCELDRVKVASVKNAAFLIVSGLQAMSPTTDLSWARPILNRLSRRARREPVEPRRIVHARSLDLLRKSGHFVAETA